MESKFITSKYMKRVYKEIEHNSYFSESEISYNLKSQCFSIKCVYDNKYSIYVELDNYYPFRPPTTVKVNNKHYDHTTWSLTKNIANSILKDYNIKCLYCDSILCANNWKPPLTIHDVIKEYENNNNMILALYAIDMLKYNNIDFPLYIEKNILSFCFVK